MTRTGAALALSLLLNVGVLLGAGWTAIRGADVPRPLVDELALSETQRQQWAEAERGFVDALRGNAAEIDRRRERLLRALFADVADAEVVESERKAIASLQQAQQQRVIAQLLREASILDRDQRARLVERLLREQASAVIDVERYHR